MGQSYTQEQKSQALALYKEHGPGEAARRLHIPSKTITSWANRAGVQSDAPAKTAAATEMARLTRDQKREKLRGLLLDKAIDLIEDMDGKMQVVTQRGEVVILDCLPANSKKDLATASAILIDKFRLEVGEATGREEVNVKDAAAHALAKAAERKAALAS